MIKLITASLVSLLAFASPAQALDVGDKLPVAAVCFEVEDALVAASLGAHEGKDAANQYFMEEGNSCQFFNGVPVLVEVVKEIKDISGKAAHLKVFEISDRSGTNAFILYKVPDKDA